MTVKIGIILRPNYNIDQQGIFSIYRPVQEAVLAFGGLPLGIVPPVTNVLYQVDYDGSKTMTESEIKLLEESLALCDGVIFPGGSSYYEYDFVAMNYCYQHNIPTLAFCLGMQIMGVFLKGHLTNVSNHHLPFNETHPVILLPHTKLKEILKVEYLEVNSRHHQQLIMEQGSLNAVSLDGVIEGIEDKEKKFFIGVSWHPEDMLSYDTMKRLWASFIASSKGEG